MRRTLVFLAVLAALLLAVVPAAWPVSGGGPSGLQAGSGPAPGCVRAGPDFEPDVEYDTETPNVEIDQRLLVSPPAFEFERPVAGGDRFLCVLMISNRRAERTTYELEPQGAIGSRSGRTGVEFLDPDDPDAAATAGSWIEPRPASVTLDPLRIARVPIYLDVPEDAPKGAAYATIDVVSRSSAPAGDTVLGIESRVAIPFLLSVGGDGVPELRLGDVRAPKLRWSRDPWTLRADLDNTGTLHATPRGRVRVRSLFGNTVNELKIAGTPLLPGGRQLVEVTWDDVPWFGIYRYDVRVAPKSDDHDDQVARAEGWFIALPPWWVLALAAAILLMAAASRTRRRRRERAWVALHDDDDESSDELQ